MLKVESTIQKERYGLILKSIFRYKRVTRIELSEILKLSSPALVKYIKVLISLGIVREMGKASSEGGGRKSVYLEFNPEKGIAIAIAMYRTYIESGLVTITGEVLEEYRHPIPDMLERDQLLAELFGSIEATIAKANGLKLNQQIFGIGIAMGGHINQEKGISYEYMFSRGWDSVQLKSIVENRYKLPVSLVKDVNACALGEQYYGNGIGVDNFLSIWIGVSIGMGIVIDGKNYTGASGYAGELGHTRGGDEGCLCYCGHTGCLEGISSEGYILEECRKGLRKGVLSEIRNICQCDFENITIQQVIQAANNGDRFSRNVFEGVGEVLGRKISDAANLFNPELILLRGPVIDGNLFLFETIKRIVMNQNLRQISHGLKILYSPHDNLVHLRGVGSVIVNGLISSQERI